MDSTARKINFSISELIDRLSVAQIKEILVENQKESFGIEIERIVEELNTHSENYGNKINARCIWLITALSQMNLHIWKKKERMIKESFQFEKELKLSHQLNGIRNLLKNDLLEEFGVINGSLKKTNVNTEDLEGWDLSVLQNKKKPPTHQAPIESSNPKYTYLLTDLIDALTINQIKEVFFRGTKKNNIIAESKNIVSDIDLCLQTKDIIPMGDLIKLLVLLAQSNLHVWMNKDSMQDSPKRYGELLDFAQDLNGIRNHVKNIMMLDFGELDPCYLRTTFLSEDGTKWYAPILNRLKINCNENEENYSSITSTELALYFGIDKANLSDDCLHILESKDFRYKTIDGSERDAVIRNIVMRLEKNDFWISGFDKKQIWENGWGENLAEYKETNDFKSLMPKFLQGKKILRLGNRYISPQSMNFEFDIVDIYRRYIFRRYLSDVNSIYEFGCGSCQHLPVLAELFPGKPIHGLDWAEASMKIIDQLGQDNNWPIEGHVFNLFSPDQTLEIHTSSGIFTIGTMEQLGDKFEPFIQFLIQKKPKIVFHIESMMELYDENSLMDYLALSYDRKRNYLKGYLDRLEELKQDGKIELLELKRVYFGSMFHDSYSIVAWKPVY